MDPEPKNIIVRMPNWIGDLVMATPVLAELRRAYPHARITAMARVPLCELLRDDPQIDELFCFSKGSSFSRYSDKKGVVEKLRRDRYDLGVLLTHSFSSAWWFWQSKITARLGYECNGRGLLLTHSLPLPDKVHTQHLVITYKALLEPLGITPTDASPRIFLNDKELFDARLLLQQHGVREDSLVVGINPGASYGSAKCWLPERFREVTERLLQEDNLFIVYFGDHMSASVVKEICQGLPARVINLAGLTSLRELACIICVCDVLLTNDSGPMHLAAAVNTPIIALFGSTNEQVTGPYRKGRVIHKHVDCSPCYQRVCPIDFRCMKRIEADEVFDAIHEVLERKINKRLALSSP